MKGSYSVATGSSRSPLIGMRQAQRRHQDEQVHLGDAELDVLALRREIPVEGRGDLLAAEQVGLLGAREQAAAVDPGAEIGRDRDVGRRGDDARGQFAIAAREFVEHQAKALLGRHLRRRRERKPLGHVDHRRRQAAAAVAVERHLGEERLQRRRILRQAFELVPLMAGPDVLLAAPFLHLGDRHQAGMVVLVALERQADALDGVGDEADRAVVIDGFEGLAACSPCRGRRDWTSAPAVRRRCARSISCDTAPWSPISSCRCLRNAAPPWKHSAA